MALADLRQRMESPGRAPEHGYRRPRARNVRDVERKAPRIPGEAVEQVLEPGRDACELVLESVEGFGIVVGLAFGGGDMDLAKPCDRIGLVQRQLEREERVAVPGVASLVMKADRDLHPQVMDRDAFRLHPPTESTGDHAQDDVIHRGVGPGLGRIVQGGERRVRERDAALRADRSVERGSAMALGEFPPQEPGEVTQAPRVVGRAGRTTAARARWLRLPDPRGPPARGERRSCRRPVRDESARRVRCRPSSGPR